MTIRFFDRKEDIRDALVRAAKSGEFPLTYEQFGDRVGIWRMRGAKDVLDAIAAEERKKGEPDITFILCSAATGYPSQIDGQPAKPPSLSQRASTRAEITAIIARYCPGKPNPYPAD